MDKLWLDCEEAMSSAPLEKASDEEIIRALFNPPPFLDPRYFGYLRRHRKSAIAKYQELYYNE
jgi:hypothetical protein